MVKQHYDVAICQQIITRFPEKQEETEELPLRQQDIILRILFNFLLNLWLRKNIN